jgi:hypothetical protein
MTPLIKIQQQQITFCTTHARGYVEQGTTMGMKDTQHVHLQLGRDVVQCEQHNQWPRIPADWDQEQ